jgi:glycosyltransferase involved in cell wall biosynthesis
MGNPKVSIAIISFNQREFIAPALSSALEQDYDNLEVIIADDASTDGTQEIITEYAQRYPERLKSVYGETNLGITGNSNRALCKCTGEFIAFQGGDDILLQGKISKQVDWFTTCPNKVLCGHDVEYFRTDNNHTIALWSDRYTLRGKTGASKVISDGVPFPATSIMVRTSAIPRSGFDNRLRYASDWLFWIETIGTHLEYGYVEGVYARYRLSETNISKQQDLMLQDQLITLAIIEYQFPQYQKEVRIARARILYRLGIYYLKRHYFEYSRSILSESFYLNRFSIKPLIALIISYSPRLADRMLQDRVMPRSGVEWIKSLRKRG